MSLPHRSRLPVEIVYSRRRRKTIQASVVDHMPTPEVCRRLEEAGVTTLTTSAWLMAGKQNAPLEENLAAIERFAAEYIAPLRGG